MPEPDVAVIVCGPPVLPYRKLVYSTLDGLTAKLRNFVLLTCADSYSEHYSEEWAFANKRTVYRFHREVDLPPSQRAKDTARNTEVVEYARGMRKAFCVAFDDGKSPNVQEMIRLCRKAGIPVRVVRYGD